MTQLLSLVLLFVTATAFNLNDGVAMTPSMVLYLLFFATASGVIIIAQDPGDPDVMHRPPRDPKVPISNRTSVLFWLLYAVVLFLGALVPLVAGPDEPRTDAPSAALTMTFVVMGLGTIVNAIANRREPASGLDAPILKAAAIALIPAALIVLATRLDVLQHSLLTQPLTGLQWLACIGLTMPLLIVIEVGKWIRRRRSPRTPLDARLAVAPAHARTHHDRTGEGDG
jgi:Ca2+-transporting ATPase